MVGGSGRSARVRCALLAAALGIAGLAPMAVAGAQTLDDLDEAERWVEQLEGDLGGVVDRYETTWAAAEATRAELRELALQADQLEGELATVVDAVEDRARAAFKRGPTATVEALLGSGDPQVAVERAGMLAALQRRGRTRIEQVDAARARLDQTRGLIVEREDQLETLQAELDATADALQRDLEAAEERAGSIRSIVARQRRIDRGGQQGIYSCIFDAGAMRFRDTWGAPRSGGRRHKGTDVFAAYRAPVYAITSGVVQRHSRSGLGGIGLYLRGDDGNVYYYAHLDSIDAAAAVGRRVTVGEQVARNGSTGNADRSAPHVHFELHPGGGGAINPYPWLAAACY